MPERVEPCLALLQSRPPTGDDWAFEVKWDGYRLAVHIGPGKKVRVITRGGHDWTSRFPTIAHDALEFGIDSAILDGEAVVLDERGASDFGALQKALGGRGGKRSAASAMLYAFDLLFLNGQDLRGLPLTERREMLEDVLARQPHGSIRLSDEINSEGAPFLKLACELGLEGIIAKRRSAPYRSGRGGDWLKIKCVQSEGFVIIGYEPPTAALGGIGRLVLAARKAGKLVYAGSVGSGFSHASATALRKQMDELVILKPAVSLSGRRQAYRWLKPALVAEVEYRAWTDDRKLRHASFKGLREEADEASVYELPSAEE
ncbi:non-homologous end-joining DNA ligase [Bosea sp. NBC_00550]|uniref:non-homologous end-joining DNA ligase n=1 Tax=Bosea sp. NBC_00550 TaxID=2969621 RepID=UPI0029FEFD93|nr:non-homologous end-joining DNA ligase [Bosea sp. NBC_00550]